MIAFRAMNTFRLITVCAFFVFLGAACEKADEAPTTATTAPTAAAAAPAKAAAAAPAKAAAAAPGAATQEGCEAACAHAQSIALTALPAEAETSVRDEMVKGFALRCVPNCLVEGTPASNACVMKASTPQDLGACQKLAK